MDSHPWSLQALGDPGFLLLSLPLVCHWPPTSSLVLCPHGQPYVIRGRQGGGLGKLPLALDGCMNQVKVPGASTKPWTHWLGQDRKSDSLHSKLATSKGYRQLGLLVPWDPRE